ncbi:MAG: DUF2110 family protein [Halobacteriaceae archaeon]
MVVLATKVYVEGSARERALDGLESMVANLLDGLDAEYEVGLRHDEFPAVTVTGEDATAARNLLAEEFGEVADPAPGEEGVGVLDSWDEEGFVLDAGKPVRVPADELGLGPGSPSQVRRRFGLVQHLPLGFVAGDPPRLADDTRDRLFEWTRGNGRVNVNSATRSEVRATVNRAGHAGDIVTVERLGLLEQSVVCAEGTDPPGLLADIGPYLEAELLCVVP